MIDATAQTIGISAGSGAVLLVIVNLLWRMLSKHRVENQRDGAQFDVIKMQREQILLLRAEAALLEKETAILQEENRMLREKLFISEARLAALKAGRPDIGSEAE